MKSVANLVVSYPTISNDGLIWIQDVRREYDELNFSAIDPHFTLVFPIADIDRKQLVSHVQQSISGVSAFEFVIRCAVVGNDAFSKYTHVFLVPDEGYSNIIKLHDRLYTGVIANELRLDLPFIPHIGIANSLDARSCKELVGRLNNRSFEICGRVDCLDILWSQADRVGTIASVNLV
jgi:2'-5' RNA ligase